MIGDVGDYVKLVSIVKKKVRYCIQSRITGPRLQLRCMVMVDEF